MFIRYMLNCTTTWPVVGLRPTLVWTCLLSLRRSFFSISRRCWRFIMEVLFTYIYLISETGPDSLRSCLSNPAQFQ